MSLEEDRFVRHFAHLGHTDERKVRELYASIEDKDLVDKVLSRYGEHPTQHLPQPNLASYRYSVPAWLHVEMFLGGALTLTIASLSKKFSGTGGGAIIMFSASGGTFHYNDLNDLQNNSDWNGNFVSVFSNVNMIRGGIYAAYAGGGLGGVGLSGGSGYWSST